MNATSATCADEDGDDDDDGEAADMEGSVSFLPNCTLATMFVSAGCFFGPFRVRGKWPAGNR